MAAVVLVYSGLSITILGFFCVLKPVRMLNLHTRGRAFLGMVLGNALLLSGMAYPAPETRIASPQTRLDEFAPIYQFHEFHSIAVNAPPERVYAAIKSVSADEVPLFKTLTWIRRGGRFSPPGILNPPEHQSLLDVATRTSFLLLAEAHNREIVIGTAALVPGGWRPTKQPTPEDSKNLRAPGFALASMNFIVEPEAANVCRVTTETRVYATDAQSARKFAHYWRVIYPGSALIRRMWLRAIKLRAQSALPQRSSTAASASGTM